MNKTTISFLRTDQLSDKNWESYIRNFNYVFKKNFSYETFMEKYLGSYLGYSFHGALINEEGDIVGMYSAIPRLYSFFGSQEIIAQGCDAFVIEDYRKDESVLKNISEIVITNLRDIGIYYHISLPNPIAYPYWKYFCGWKEILKLDYHIVPLKLGNILGKLKFLNILSYLVFKTVAIIDHSAFHSKKHEKKEISLRIDSSFQEQRYGKKYISKNPDSNKGFVYREYDENRIKAVYLIDCFEKSPRNMAMAIRHVMFDKNCNPDVIIFLGKTKCCPWYMIKIPQTKEPRHQPFLGLSTNPETSGSFYSQEFWDISLANFDNR